MREELRWGSDIPYMITGMLNQHPRSAMQFNASQRTADDVVKFFDDDDRRGIDGEKSDGDR